MGRVAPALEQVEAWFHDALADAGRGLTYARTWKAFSEITGYKERASKSFLSQLRDGIDRGLVKSISHYSGPAGRLYGRTEDPTFAQAKSDAEKPPPIVQEPWIALGGRFNRSTTRVRWELCPEKSRMMKTVVLTVGIVDFMRCDVCKRYHALGIRPEYADRRPHAWELDPLFFKDDYADELSHRLYGQKKSRIARVRRGGQYQGLMYRAVEWANPEVWNEAMDRARSLQWKSRGNRETAGPKGQNLAKRRNSGRALPRAVRTK